MSKTDDNLNVVWWNGEADVIIQGRCSSAKRRLTARDTRMLICSE